MSTKIDKSQKTTIIEFDEANPTICVRTHNTALKKKLNVYAAANPNICRQTGNDQGCLTFEIEKGRFSFRLTSPYSKARREAARKTAIENNYAERLNIARRISAERKRAAD